jgi:hypoxanthine phosphoribosyltransferase
MQADIERILITPEMLTVRLDELGHEITADYHDKPLVLIGILRGCLPFLADLTRRLPFKHSFDMVGASSYGRSTESSGHVTITKDIDVDISGKHVLIAEDIYDTGRTLRVVLDLLSLHKPASLHVCALLWKQKERRAAAVPIRYVGFEIPDEFVVGYGLDYNEVYRNLPSIGVLRKEIYDPRYRVSNRRER